MVNSIYSKEEKQIAIDYIKSADIETIEIEDLQKQFEIIVSGYYNDFPQLFPPKLFYRGIRYVNKPTEFHNLIYPPTEKAVINRVNAKGESLFYCSDDHDTIFHELSIKEGERIIMTKWLSIKPILCAIVGYAKQSFSNLTALRPNPHNQKHFLHIIGDIIENEKLEELFSEVFCQKVNDDNQSHYKVSIALARVLLNPKILDRRIKSIEQLKNSTKPLINGIVYPTIKNDAVSENYCFSKETIDKNFLEVDQIEYIEISGIEKGLYQYKILDIAFSLTDNRVNWLNLGRTWTRIENQDELQFSDVSGRLEAYDSNGEMIPSD